MSSYIGYTPRVLTDTTNQLSDQVIPIVLNVNNYTLNFAPTSDNLLMVSVNGSLYAPTLDFYILGNIITFTKTDFPDSGIIYIYFLGANYFRINSVSDGSIQHNHLASELKIFNFQKFVGDGTSVDFILEFFPGSAYALFVLVDNVLLQPAIDYSLVSNILTFAISPTLNQEIVVRNLGFKSSLTEYNIPTRSITTDKLAEMAVQTSKINDLAVTNDKIANSTITFTKINNSLLSDIFFYSVIISNTTLLNTKSYKLLVNTSANSITITLPASPSIGQTVEILDYNNTFDEYTLTIIRNGKTIDNSNENVIFYKQGVHCTLIYRGENDWKIIYFYSGMDFVGVQYSFDASLEAWNTTAERHNSYIMYHESLFVYSVEASKTNYLVNEVLTITFTFEENYVEFVLGAGPKPKIILQLSDLITTKEAILNEVTSTDSTLVFEYTIESNLFTEGLTIMSFNNLNQVVNINGHYFLITEVPLNVNFNTI